MSEDLEDDFDDVDDGSAIPDKPAKGGGSKKLIVFILLPLLLLGGLGAGLYFSGAASAVLSMFGGGGQVASGEGDSDGKPAVFYDLPEMLVNLNSAGQRKQSFLKIRVSLELRDAVDIGQIELVMPRIIDNFQVYLRELRVDDLQGAAGVYRLREELLTRVNAAVRPAKVNDVLFKEMLVQ